MSWLMSWLMPRLLTPLPTGLWRPLRALLRDSSGIAAVEFGFALPVMVIMFCGLFEVSMAIIVYMKVIDVADTISDLTAQYKQVSSSDFDNFLTAGQLVMLPDSGTGLGLAIASVKFDPNTGATTADWQVTRGGGAQMTDLLTVSAGLGSPGESVIVARATYTYTSILKYILPNGIPISSRVFSRPRLVTAVTCTAPCN